MLFSTQSQQSQNLVEGEALPCSFVRFIFAASGWHQLAVSAISVAVFLLDAAPIETQRRIIDAAVKGGTASTILTLIAAQCALIVAFALSKLVMNVYRAWLGESAMRALRVLVEERLARTDVPEDHPNSGTGLAMIFAEADDVGAFVGSSISEPIVEAGFLISVFAYLAALESRMALLSLAVLAPQFVFVPLMQRAINRRVARRTQTLRQFGNDMLAAVPFIGNGRNVERLDEVFALDMGVIKLKFSLNFLMKSYLFVRQHPCSRHWQPARHSRASRDRDGDHLSLGDGKGRRSVERRGRLGAEFLGCGREVRADRAGHRNDRWRRGAETKSVPGEGQDFGRLKTTPMHSLRREGARARRGCARWRSRVPGRRGLHRQGLHRFRQPPNAQPPVRTAMRRYAIRPAPSGSCWTFAELSRAACAPLWRSPGNPALRGGTGSLTDVLKALAQRSSGTLGGSVLPGWPWIRATS